MRAIWNGTLSTVRCEPLTLDGLAWPVELHIHPRARRLRLRLDERKGVIRLTCPPRARRDEAIAWAKRQKPWIDAQVDRLVPTTAIAPGQALPFDGRELILEWREGETRRVRLEGDLLWCGGPRDGFDRRIMAWLRSEALRRLSAETQEIAGAAGVVIAAVAVGDAATRWGSCSADGRIRFNWRLLLAPPQVRRYVVAHEVAHRRHMDHGAKFHALEEQLFGGPVEAPRSMLRRIGPGLKRVGLG